MCNRWCLDFAARALPHVPAGSRTLEIGSLDVNGTVRDVLAGPSAAYHGVDIRPGPGVDEVLDVTRLADRFEPGAFDLVATTEMLEHCPDWQEALYQMLRVLRPDGLLLLTTRSPGFPLHDHPGDHWRFASDELRRILEPVAAVVDVQDDFSLGWPCGVGVLARRKADEAALRRWREAIGARAVPAVDPEADAFTESNSSFMPFHQYAGYRACAEVIAALGLVRPRVLDAGGSPPRLRLCAPRLDVVTGTTARVDCAVSVAGLAEEAPEALDARIDGLARAAPDAILLVEPAGLAARAAERMAGHGFAVASASRGHVAWSRPLAELWRRSRETRAVADRLAPLLAEANRRFADLDHLEPGDRRLIVGVRGRPLPALKAAGPDDAVEAARRLGAWWASADALFELATRPALTR